MSRFVSRRALPALAALLLLPMAAWAHFATTGDGSGSGSAAIDRTVTISAGTITQTLIPTGSPSADLNVTLANATNGPLRVTGLVLDTSRGASGYSANATGCAVSYSSPQDNGGNGWTVPASGSSMIALASAASMGTSAPSSCQGQTFTIYLKAA